MDKSGKRSFYDEDGTDDVLHTSSAGDIRKRRQLSLLPSTDFSYDLDMISSESQYCFASAGVGDDFGVGDDTVIPSSPVLTGWSSQNNHPGLNEAVERINNLFEYPSSTVKLELSNLNLQSVPTQLLDIPKFSFVTADEKVETIRKIELFLQHNQLQQIPSVIYKLDSLSVLSLRDNDIDSIGNGIGNLSNLVELNLVKNRIRFLPNSFLKLNALSNLNLSFNPLVTPPNSATDVKRANANPKKCLRCIEIIRYEPTMVPTLSELCLRAISKYDATARESKSWQNNVPFNISIKMGEVVGKEGHICCICDSVVINPIAEAMEWWDIADVKLVPIKKYFCKGGCYLKWNEEVIYRENGKDEIQ